MKISFQSSSLAKCCNSEREGDKKWGKDCAKKIRQRLKELQAANSLADIPRTPPPRCHALGGPLIGTLSVDVKQPFRILFIPDDATSPSDKVINTGWNKITAIKVIDIRDTH